MINDLSHFKTVVIDPSHDTTTGKLADEVVATVTTMYRNYRDARLPMETVWVDSWAQYLNTPDSNKFSRSQTLREVGNVKSDWRHRINTGKAFESVETVVSYLMQSLFPSRHWLSVEAHDYGYEELARVVQYLLQKKLHDWKFIVEIASFIRQAAIVGNSVLAMPWEAKSGIHFETLDIFDCYFNPRESDVEKSPFIRRIRQTRVDVIEKMNSGYYTVEGGSGTVIGMAPGKKSFGTNHDIEYDEKAQIIRQFLGVDVAPCSLSDRLPVMEYWGDLQLPGMVIKDCVATICCGHLVRLTPNPYKCGRPFIVGTFIPVVRQAYGLSATQSSSGLIHALNLVTNQLLDGVELAVNPMYTLEPDSSLRPEDIRLEPGGILPVDRHGALQPLSPPQNNFGLGFQSLQFLEQTTNRNIGIGPLIGGTGMRSGERVTAEEVKAVQEAGGNRLFLVFTHLKNTAVSELLRKLLSIVQQFTDVDEVVPVTSADRIVYYEVGADELKFDYNISARGAEYVIEQEDLTQRRLQILSVIQQLPPEQIAAIDIQKLLADIIGTLLHEDPARYIKASPQEAQPESNPMAAAEQGLEANVAVDGGQNMMMQALGLDVPGGINNGNPSELTQPTPGQPSQY